MNINPSVFQTQYENARKRTFQRIKEFETNQDAVLSWRERKEKKLDFINPDVSDEVYEEVLDQVSKSSEAAAWFFKNSRIAILHEPGLDKHYIERIVQGVEYLQQFGINLSYDLIDNAEDVISVYYKLQEAGKILDEAKARRLLGYDLDDIIKKHYETRPGILLALDSQFSPSCAGVTLNEGIVITKSSILCSIASTTAHELIHYLGIAGRRDLTDSAGHCREKCLMSNGSISSQTLCEFHYSALHGSYRGIQDALKQAQYERDLSHSTLALSRK